MTISREGAVVRALNRLLAIKVAASGNDPDRQDDGATLAAVRAGIKAIIDVIDMEPGIPLDTLAERETGPENSREEVVGTSTRGRGYYSPSSFSRAVCVLDPTAIPGSP